MQKIIHKKIGLEEVKVIGKLCLFKLPILLYKGVIERNSLGSPGFFVQSTLFNWYT